MNPFCPNGGLSPGGRVQAEDANRGRLALQFVMSAVDESGRSADQGVNALPGEQDGVPGGLGQLPDPGGDVDRVADQRELEFAAATNCSGNHETPVDADADAKTPAEMFRDQRVYAYRGGNRCVGVFCELIGCTEDHQGPVAEKLVDVATPLDDSATLIGVSPGGVSFAGTGGNGGDGGAAGGSGGAAGDALATATNTSDVHGGAGGHGGDGGTGNGGDGGVGGAATAVSAATGGDGGAGGNSTSGGLGGFGGGGGKAVGTPAVQGTEGPNGTPSPV